LNILVRCSAWIADHFHIVETPRQPCTLRRRVPVLIASSPPGLRNRSTRPPRTRLSAIAAMVCAMGRATRRRRGSTRSSRREAATGFACCVCIGQLVADERTPGAHRRCPPFHQRDALLLGSGALSKWRKRWSIIGIAGASAGSTLARIGRHQPERQACPAQPGPASPPVEHGRRVVAHEVALVVLPRDGRRLPQSRRPEELEHWTDLDAGA
jgi:hypothetical protein